MGDQTTTNSSLPPLFQSAITAIQNAKLYSAPVGGNTTAVFVLAVILYIIVSAYLPPNAAIGLAVVIILGALLVNQKATGGKTIFQTLGLEKST